MREIKVSIITVSLNSVHTIEQTILSVLDQSYQNIEYIIIDGKSTDGTCNIIKKYEDVLFYYVSEPDKGIYDAMNKGLRRATGDIIGLINSDDWYEADAVSKVVNHFTSGKAELVHGKMCFIDEKGNCTCSKEKMLSHLWYMAGIVLHPTVFVKRSVYEKYGVFNTDYRIAADYDLLLRFYAKGVRFEYIDEIISNFRTGGISSDNYLEGNEEARRIALSYIDQCPNKDFVLTQIYRNYELTKNIPIIEEKPSIVCDFLREEFQGVEEGTVVFGTGEWGGRIESVLRFGKIPIVMFVDNNETMWGTRKNGIAVYSPQKLRDYKGCVIIAVKDGCHEISRQLTELGNAALKMITLEDIWKGVSGK